MKRNNIFIGMIFIGFGVYYLTQEITPTLAEHWLSWETLLIWIGLALSMDGFIRRNGTTLLPGIFMVGMGLHFHAIAIYPNWPTHAGMIATLLGIACLITYLKTKKEFLFIGILLMCIGFLFIFFEPLVQRIETATETYAFIWPLLLIVTGFILLFKRQKKRKVKG
ncbi:membrane-bound ClpP family serine protease [Geomicrobium halophilum]|uniref:Membrane-bound ClpP family serine protease n=1 Tax=Geomicrobium halophilum TaxID=549000 RepID=A0A841PPV3_9BACL|nr:DUF5668 domain-containing protein [Geomicrobium halophilum]MBB6448331.1 membrane-bound ClpP family serine protease [Geomicrobium halophilum]